MVAQILKRDRAEEFHFLNRTARNYKPFRLTTATAYKHYSFLSCYLSCSTNELNLILKLQQKFPRTRKSL